LGVYLDFLVALGAIFFVKVCFKRTFFYEHFLFKIGEIKISVEILRDNLIKTHDSSAFFFGKVSKINKEAHTKEKVMGKNIMDFFLIFLIIDGEKKRRNEKYY
jgi:hypothetical protein